MAEFNLNAMHMSNDRNYEVQRVNHFGVIFENFSDDMILAVKSFNRPTQSSGSNELHYGNTNVNVAGKLTTENASLVVNDFIKPNIEKQFQEWRDKVTDPRTGKMGWVDEYKMNGRLYEYGPDGTCQRIWRLKGCWPSTYSSNVGDYSNGGTVELNMTILCDQAYIEDEQ